MRNARLSWTYLIVVVVLLVILLGVGRYIGGPLGGDAIANVFGVPAKYLFERFSFIRSTVERISNIGSLVSENEHLVLENARLLAEVGSLNSVKDDNAFLVSALSLRDRSNRQIITGNIFSISQGTDGYTALLNIGSDAGVEQHQSVLTPEGILVGEVEEVFKRTANILLVTDPRFSATAKVLGGTTIGIVKGDGPSGAIMDLIVHGDTVNVDNQIVTSGDDLFPAGIVIGKVISVQESNVTVFKKVIIAPLAQGLLQGKVIILSK